MVGSGRQLRAGEAVSLDSLGLTAADGLRVGVRALRSAAPDLVALLVGSSGLVRSDDDLVF